MTDRTPPIQENFDLERNRPYLVLLAQLQLGKQLQGRLDPDDVVQQTFADAHRKRGQFRGRTDADLRAWLRQILVNQIITAHRRLVGAQQEQRERQLQNMIDTSSARLENWLRAEQTSTSERAVRHEQVERMAAALADLPDAQREALLLKHCQGWTLEQISQHQGRTVVAVAGLLKRGMQHLRASMQEGE